MSSETFSSAPKKTSYTLNRHFLILPPSPETTKLPSVSIDLLIPGISCKWNHTICGLLHLASFTQRHISEVHLCCSRCQCFIPFFFWLHHSACRILAPRPGIEPGPPAWKPWVLTTGLPGNSQCFIPFYGWIIFHCMGVTRFVYPFIHSWTFGLFPSAAIVNSSTTMEV